MLQSDGSAAYPDYVRTHPKVAWVGCWAHARRKFFEATGERPADAARALGLIAQLYQHETQWDEAQVGDQRAALRQEHFAQPLAELKTLAQELLAGPVLPQSGLGQACTYLLGHWAPLTAHLHHSHTKLDTNAVEPFKSRATCPGHPERRLRGTQERRSCKGGRSRLAA